MQSSLNESESGQSCPDASDAYWAQIAPLLEPAMGQLGAKDHDALVLRFFEGKNFREIGQAMGGNEDTARMRVNRALEKLRKIFTKRGVAVPTALIAGAISVNSVHAAPTALATSVTAVAMTKGVAASGSTLTLVKGALKIMTWTKLKTTAVVSAAVMLTTISATGVYEIHQTFRKGPSYFPRSTWESSGFTTPEGTLKSFMWAKSVGDIKTVLFCATPEMRQEVENQYFKNKSDQERSNILVENVKKVTAVRVQQKIVLSDDWVVLKVHFDGLPKDTFAKVTMNKIGNDWKVSRVEEHQ